MSIFGAAWSALIGILRTALTNPKTLAKILALVVLSAALIGWRLLRIGLIHF